MQIKSVSLILGHPVVFYEFNGGKIDLCSLYSSFDTHIDVYLNTVFVAYHAHDLCYKCHNDGFGMS